VPPNDSALEVLAEIGRKEGYVFTNPRTGNTRRVSIAKTWERLRTLAELPHLRLHDLRSSFASFPANNGRSIHETSILLGHSDVKITAERYAHLSQKTLQDASNAASLAIKGARRKVA